MGSPASSACMFLGGSGILDKAVSCLRPWREVITGPTSTGLTGRLGGNFKVSGATAPPCLQRAIPPHPASMSVGCFLSRPCAKFHLDSRYIQCVRKLIYVPVWLGLLYHVSYQEMFLLFSDVSMNFWGNIGILFCGCFDTLCIQHTKASWAYFSWVEPSSSANTDTIMSLLSLKVSYRDRDREVFSVACL